MTWTISTTTAAGSTVSAALPDPEFGDSYRATPRQLVFESDGGQRHVQDLGVVDESIELTWRHLSHGQWSDARRVLEAARWQGRDIKLVITSTNGNVFPLRLRTGLTVHNGQALKTGMAITTGMTVLAEGGTIAGLRLLTPDTVFEHQARARATLTLAFRLQAGPLVAGT